MIDATNPRRCQYRYLCATSAGSLTVTVAGGAGWKMLNKRGSFLIENRPRHKHRHHRHNNSNLDWVRCSLVTFRRNWLNLLAFPFVSVATMRAEKESDLRQWRAHHRSLYGQALAERVVLYAVMAALTLADWQATLRALVVPWLFGQWGIVTINLLQHQGCDPATPACQLSGKA